MHKGVLQKKSLSLQGLVDISQEEEREEVNKQKTAWPLEKHRR
jgi:hypothetical protein